MILFTFFALFSALFLLWRRARPALAALGLLLLWLLAAGWLAAPLLDLVQRGAPDTTNPRFAPDTVIVLLGSGTEYDRHGALIPKHDAMARITAVARLYERCRRHQPQGHCTVIVSGGNPQHHEQAEADNYAPYLLRSGVAKADLVRENTSRNTYQNAAHVARMLRHRHYGALILVTSAYHMPRAMLDFDRFGLAPQPLIANVRHVRRGLLPHLSNLVDANIALHEIIGIAQFHTYRALGWF